jgi:hypothetical protein
MPHPDALSHCSPLRIILLKARPIGDADAIIRANEWLLLSDGCGPSAFLGSHRSRGS